MTLFNINGYRSFHEAGIPGIAERSDARILILSYSFDLDLAFNYKREVAPNHGRKSATFR